MNDSRMFDGAFDRLTSASLVAVALSGILGMVAAVGCGEATQVDGEVDPSLKQLPSPSSQTQAIKNGEVDQTSTAVVGLALQRGGGASVCTGTLIAPNLVLTARHCVSQLSSRRGIQCGSTTFEGTYGADSILVTTETYLRETRNFYRVSDIHTRDSNEVCGNDIALLTLQDEVPSSEAEPRQPRLEQKAQSGETYTAIGYGRDGNESGSSGVRRILENREVECVGDQCYGRYVQGSEWTGSGGTCKGDSGGGAYASDGRVFGILSRGGRDCSSALYSSVYQHRRWIRTIAGRAASNGGYPTPGWANVGPDSDNDGIPDEYDNCPTVQNEDQVDTDGDGKGDACDSDSDGDGVPDESDNCPKTENPEQADADGDGQGDACSADSDGDGVADEYDNCPKTPNPDQKISDGDGTGDACDDSDDDGVKDLKDNCPQTPNPDQTDSNGDGKGDACTGDDSNDQQTDEQSNDQDGTGADGPDEPSVVVIEENQSRGRGCSAASGDGPAGAVAPLMFLALLVGGARYRRRR